MNARTFRRRVDPTAGAQRFHRDVARRPSTNEHVSAVAAELRAMEPTPADEEPIGPDGSEPIAPDGSEPVGPEVEEPIRGQDQDPISPELALVSEELRERARAELPERPWEHFGRVGERFSIDPRAKDGVVSRSPLRHLRHFAFAIPVGAAGVVAAVLWVGTNHSSSPPPAAPANRLGALPGVGPVGAVHAGGYVFDGGVLQVGKNGTTVEALSFTRGCAKGGIVKGPVPLRGHLFRFSRRLAGKQMRVVVTGVFFRPTQATLLIDLRGGACGSQALRETARLS
jgi:hypothetical protein